MAEPKDGNPEWILFVFHFVPCDLIYQHYEEIRPHFLNPKTQQETASNFISYLHLWMALLYVVADGFRELGLSDASITPILNEHLDELRVFRNSVFHFQKDDRKRTQFQELDKLNWALKLHVAFRNYFTAKESA